MRNLLVAVAVASTIQAQVPVWVQNPTNGHHYAVTEQLSWSAAELKAQTYGGHLVTIRSAAENQWLASTFTNGVECLWIGLNDAQVEGQFVWSSGEPVTFTNWWPGEPSNDLGNGDWVHLSLPWAGPVANAHWNDSPNNAVTYGWVSRGIMEVENLSPLAAYVPFGSGCAGPYGLVPALAAAPGQAPRAGTTSYVRVSNLTTDVTVPVFVIGLSNTWDPDGYALPIDLGVVGWPGCPQLVADQGIYYTITTAGQADQGITVPPGYPGGFTFYVQVLTLYLDLPGVAAVSNAVAGVVGY